jgi:hypothetical protein
MEIFRDFCKEVDGFSESLCFVFSFLVTDATHKFM